MSGEIGSCDLDWGACENCKYYFEEGVKNGCLAVSTKAKPCFPDEGNMTFYLDYNNIIVECDLFEEKE